MKLRGSIFFLGPEAGLTNRVDVWHSDAGAPLVARVTIVFKWLEYDSDLNQVIPSHWRILWKARLASVVFHRIITLSYSSTSPHLYLTFVGEWGDHWRWHILGNSREVMGYPGGTYPYVCAGTVRQRPQLSLWPFKLPVYHDVNRMGKGKDECLYSIGIHPALFIFSYFL